MRKQGEQVLTVNKYQLTAFAFMYILERKDLPKWIEAVNGLCDYGQRVSDVPYNVAVSAGIIARWAV